ncbi:MAG: DUF1080 domain-containing protein [Verrucomicrobiota bacterium]
MRLISSIFALHVFLGIWVVSANDRQLAEQASATDEEAQALFNGKDLTNWNVTNFGGEGEVDVRDGILFLEMGDPLTGINWDSTQEIPKSNYELTLEAKKLLGEDFFCGVTFPVGESHATFVCGGWGGAVVGISSIDYLDASENDTTDFMKFEEDRWYSIRIKVTDAEVIAWIDEKEMARVSLADHEVMLRSGPIELSVPLGIANFQTRSALKDIKLRMF